MKTLIVLSQSKIKQKAVEQIFSKNDFNINFVEVPDNPYRESQPLFIDGTKLACEQRMDEYINRYGNIMDNNTFVISIENGILALDVNTLSESNWGDFCVIGLLKNNNLREYVISPEIIHIDKIYSEVYFKYFYKKKSDFDTLGKYIASCENVPHNNWMKDITGIDRVHQIKLGLQKIKNSIDY